MGVKIVLNFERCLKEPRPQVQLKAVKQRNASWASWRLLWQPRLQHVANFVLEPTAS